MDPLDWIKVCSQASLYLWGDLRNWKGARDRTQRWFLPQGIPTRKNEAIYMLDFDLSPTCVRGHMVWAIEKQRRPALYEH